MKVRKQIWNPTWTWYQKITSAFGYCLVMAIVSLILICLFTGTAFGQNATKTGEYYSNGIKWDYTYSQHRKFQSLTLTRDGLSAFYSWYEGQNNTLIPAWDEKERVLSTKLAAADSIMVWDCQSVRHVSPKSSDGLPTLEEVRQHFNNLLKPQAAGGGGR